MQEESAIAEATSELNDQNSETKVEEKAKNDEKATDSFCLTQAKCDNTTGTKSKRKARSTRKRLNALMNNTSIHFSDSDSEGELSYVNPQARNSSPSKRNSVPENMPHPVVSVMIDGVAYPDTDPLILENVYLTKERRNSFVDTLTDVDEIYTSEPEEQELKKVGRNNLAVTFNGYQGETDLEDFSNEEGEEQTPIYVEPCSDFLIEFNEETIITKEGDGPFSMEVRNQIFNATTNSVAHSETPDIIVMPNTDSEDMDASDEDETAEGVYGSEEELEDLDMLVASQTVMRNVNKMENLLNIVKDISDDGISDCYTDVEDLE